MLRDHSIIKAGNASITSGLLNVVSVGRSQLYREYDQWIDFTFTLAVLGMVALWMISYSQCYRMQVRVNCKESLRLISHSSPEKLEIEKTDEMEDEDLFKKLAVAQTLLLEDTIRQEIKLDSLSKRKMDTQEFEPWTLRTQSECSATASLELELTLQMRSFAMEFIKNRTTGIDSKRHCAMLCAPYKIFRIRRLIKEYQSVTRKWALTVVAFLGVILEVACESDSPFCDDNSVVYFLQGLLVFWLGVNIVFDAAIEIVIIPQMTALGLGISPLVAVGQPMLWGMLAGSTLCSQTYFCDSGFCASKHYLFPAIVMIANVQVRVSLISFW